MNPTRRFRLMIGGMLVLIAAVAVLLTTLRPQRTRVVDLKLGTGPAAKAGDVVLVHYVGKLTDGTKFDSSRDRNQPFDFPLGAGQVIKGWDAGVAGMRAGGVRRLIIPPAEGYGEVGSPPVIPPNSTLEFEVELLSIK